MSLIGMTVRLDQSHPQELIDALYREYFDNHPDACEIDLVLAIQTADEREDGRAYGMTIVDARLMRVSDPDTERGHRYLAVPEEGGPITMLREMVDWQKRVPGSNGFLWIHKMPEGFAVIDDMIVAWSQTLSTIDYATGDGKRRRYVLGASVNRTTSRTIRPARSPVPDTGLIDIDLPVITKILEDTRTRHNLGEDHPFSIAAREHIAAQRYIRETEDQHGEPEHMAAHETATRTAIQMSKILSSLDEVQRRAAANPQLRAAMDVTAALSAEYERRHGTVEVPLPTLPKDIFGLPVIDLPAADNTKKRDLLN